MAQQKQFGGEMRNKKGQFIKGIKPWNKGKSEVYSKETRKKMGADKVGKISWNKNLHIQTNTGKTHFKKGFIPWHKGTKGVVKPNSGSFKKGLIPWCKGRKGLMVAWNKGIKGYKNKGSFKKGETKGKKSYNWLGGISFEPYGLKFNKELKQRIRKRDNYTCRECGYSQEDLGYKLHVHHIDYNKRNNSEDNLISLCQNCHAQTNYNRSDWTKYYKEKING